LQTEFKYYEKIKIKDTNKFKYGINLICRRGKTFIFPKNTLQLKVEEIIKVHIDECLDEIKRAIS
jgi:hypothetical protein